MDGAEEQADRMVDEKVEKTACLTVVPMVERTAGKTVGKKVDEKVEKKDCKTVVSRADKMVGPTAESSERSCMCSIQRASTCPGSKPSTKTRLDGRNMWRRCRGCMHWTLWRTNTTQLHMHSRAPCLEHRSLEELPHKMRMLHRRRGPSYTTSLSGSYCYYGLRR